MKDDIIKQVDTANNQIAKDNYVSMQKIVSLSNTGTDLDYAQDLRNRIIKLWEPILAILDEANDKGFNVDIGCGLGPLGKYGIMQCRIVKILMK